VRATIGTCIFRFQAFRTTMVLV